MPSLPAKCFLSHSYGDAEAVEQARRVLGPQTKLEIFPKRDVDADSMVSDPVFDRITDCTGLVYLTYGHSALSFWVRLESDFAKRAGLPVFAFDPVTGRLEPDQSNPISIRVLPLYKENDVWIAFRILRYLERERFLSDLFDDKQIRPADAQVWDLELSARDRCVVEFARDQPSFTVPEDLSHRLVVAALDRSARCPDHLRDWQFVQLCRDTQKHITGGRPLRDAFRPNRFKLLHDPRDLPGPNPAAADYPIQARNEMRRLREQFQVAGPDSPWSLPEGLDLSRIDDLVIRIFRVCFAQDPDSLR